MRSNIRAILGGFAALSVLLGFTTSPVFYSISKESWIIGLLFLIATFVFAGFFISALSQTKPLVAIFKSIMLCAGISVVGALVGAEIIPNEHLGYASNSKGFGVVMAQTLGTVFVFLLGFILAMLGGFFEQLLKQNTGTRKHWNYRTQDGVEIPVLSSKRHLGLGIFWVVFTVACTIATPVFLNSGILLWVSILFLAASLARRHLLTLADISIIESGRFFLFLRAFSDDEMAFVQGSFFRKLWSANKLIRSNSLEYGVVKQIKRIYPVIAIGKPDERLPPDGSLRLYVDNEHWQALVADLANKSSLIILQAGESEGLQWEIDLIGSVATPEKTIVFYPLELRRGLSHASRRQLQYCAFKSKFERAFGKVFPIALGNAYFQSVSNEKSGEFVNRTFHEARNVQENSGVVFLLAKARLFAPLGWRPTAEWVMIGVWILLLIFLFLGIAHPVF